MGNFEYGFDRSAYLLKIVKWFSVRDDKIIIGRIYNQLLGELERKKTPYNQMDTTEKIRILKECYRSFKSDEFRAGLKGIRLKKIAQDFGEEMLGLLKRRYDMSDKCIPGLIPSKINQNGKKQKMVGVKTLKDDDKRCIPYVDLERGVTIQQTGELVYSDGVTLINDIKQYQVTIPVTYCDSIEKTIFTKEIDFDLLAQDEKYEDAIFSELLSLNNIEKTNAGGYIGEIIKSNKMQPGDENNKESGFYTYQISDTYALSVDPIVVSAAKIIEERNKVKDKDDEGR